MIQEEISMDILLMLCLNNILDVIKKNISSLQKKLTSIIQENISKKESKKTFSNEQFLKQFMEMQKNIETENTKILSNLLHKTLKYFNGIEDLDVYLRSYLNFREVLKNIKNENLDYKNLLKKQFFDFITPLLEDKFKFINKALEDETWSAAFNENSEKNTLILSKLQSKINLIFYKNFNDYKSIVNVDMLNKIVSAQNFNYNNNLNTSIDSFSINQSNFNYESIGESNLNNNVISNNINNNEKKNNEIKGVNTFINSENKNIPQNSEIKNTIEFRDGKFKIMNSTITIINCIFETYKILLVCEDSLMPHICDSICSQIRRFLEYHREMVLDGEGVRKGLLKAIYQKEISIVCSNSLIIKRFVELFDSSQLLSPIFVELRNSIEIILKTCRVKMNELFQLMYLFFQIF